MITDWTIHKQQLLQDPEVRQAYNDLEIEFLEERAMIEDRLSISQ